MLPNEKKKKFEKHTFLNRRRGRENKAIANKLSEQPFRWRFQQLAFCSGKDEVLETMRLGVDALLLLLGGCFRFWVVGDLGIELFLLFCCRNGLKMFIDWFQLIKVFENRDKTKFLVSVIIMEFECEWGMREERIW